MSRLDMWHSQILASWNFSSNLDFIPWIGEKLHIGAEFQQFSRINKHIRGPENSQKFIPKSGSYPIQGTRSKNVKYKRTNRSRTLTRYWVLSPGLENNETLQYISDSFHAPWHTCCSWKTVETPLRCLAFLQSRGQCQDYCWSFM